MTKWLLIKRCHYVSLSERFYSFKVHVQYDSGYSFDALFYHVIFTNFGTAFPY